MHDPTCGYQKTNRQNVQLEIGDWGFKIGEWGKTEIGWNRLEYTKKNRLEQARIGLFKPMSL